MFVIEKINHESSLPIISQNKKRKNAEVSTNTSRDERYMYKLNYILTLTTEWSTSSLSKFNGK